MEELTVHETPCMIDRMELHALDGDALAAKRVAGELRAELARQKRTSGELASVLGISPHTTGRRLNGETPFNVAELAAACRWLGVSLAEIIQRAEKVAVAS